MVLRECPSSGVGVLRDRGRNTLRRAPFPKSATVDLPRNAPILSALNHIARKVAHFVTAYVAIVLNSATAKSIVETIDRRRRLPSTEAIRMIFINDHPT